MTSPVLGRSIARRLAGTPADAPGTWAIFGLASVGTFMTTLGASIDRRAGPCDVRASPRPDGRRCPFLEHDEAGAPGRF